MLLGTGETHEPRPLSAVSPAMLVPILLALSCATPVADPVPQPAAQPPQWPPMVVEALPPLPGEFTLLVRKTEAGNQLIGVDGRGDFHELRALPGVLSPWNRTRRADDHSVPAVIVDRWRREVLWIRGDSREVVVASVDGGEPRVLGYTHEHGAVGIVADRQWAWTDTDPHRIRREDGSILEMPESDHFVSNRPSSSVARLFAGGDAQGRPCVVGGRGYFGSDPGPVLTCLEDGVWTWAPRSGDHSKFQIFVGLYDGGRAAQWWGNYKYDCGLSGCGWWDPVVPGEPARRYPFQPEGELARYRELLPAPVPWTEVTMSIDGQSTLVRSPDGAFVLVPTRGWRETGQPGSTGVTLAGLADFRRVQWR